MRKFIFLLMSIFLYAKGLYVGISYVRGISNHTMTTNKPYSNETQSIKEKTNLSYFLYKIGYETKSNNNLELCFGNELFFNHIFRWKKDKFWFDIGYGIGFYKIEIDNYAFGGKILSGIEYEIYKNWSVLGFCNYLTGINVGYSVSELDKSYFFEVGVKYQF